MHLNKWVVAGLLAVGLLSMRMQHARAYTVSDLYGSWTGTFTPTSNATLITLSGITDYTGGAGYYGTPQPNVVFTFGTSTAFAFSAAPVVTTPPPGFIPFDGETEQTSGSVSGDTFTWTFETLGLTTTSGTYFPLGNTTWTGTLQLNSSSQLVLAGTRTYSWIPTELPDDSYHDEYLASDGTFSVTLQQPSAPTVPLPPAAWSALAMLGGLAVLQYVRSRRRLALNA